MKPSNHHARPAAGVTPRRARGRPAANEAGGADALLRNARIAFARRGYEATSVREIAKASGVDPALVAHHFGSKESLWLAVVERIAGEAAPLIEKTGRLRDDAGLGARERVEAALSLLIDQVFATPDVGMFFSTAATESGVRLDVLIERLVRPYHDVLVPLLADAIDAAAVPPQDAQIMFMLLVNAISKTVSYGHVLGPFSVLPKRPRAFRQAVLASALAMLG
ncbi:TetR/AcrR family transcriptional regulator [Burkholderia glumae]|uniref:TetR/AcrR family transcriptional regulator n=1 Tax=Burkholderia glumae TaxID=337 RepID=UPI0021516E90|nr:TetR/AcrR family transcriptional regulator [Burkholderia glumae]UVS95523.1 TetR/AcrR family transcriptional regulator [Burkholderia glumae]